MSIIADDKKFKEKVKLLAEQYTLEKVKELNSDIKYIMRVEALKIEEKNRKTESINLEDELKKI